MGLGREKKKITRRKIVIIYIVLFLFLLRLSALGIPSLSYFTAPSDTDVVGGNTSKYI